MYDDRELQSADPEVAEVFRTALERSKRAPGLAYEQSLPTTSRFDLLVHVEKKAQTNYYGYSDIVYTGSQTQAGYESYLFGNEKFKVVRAMQGLSLRIVINLTNCVTSAQRLSTLVHEMGVHGARLYAALSTFNAPLYSVSKRAVQVPTVGQGQVQVEHKQQVRATEQDMKEVQREHVRSEVYSANFHHTEFGRGHAADYNDLRDLVTAVLTEKADKPFAGLVAFATGMDWAALRKAYLDDIALDEEHHERVYWHPVVEAQHLLEVAAQVEATSNEFAQRAKALRNDTDVISFLTNLFNSK
jgi:hypothetical protein